MKKAVVALLLVCVAMASAAACAQAGDADVIDMQALRASVKADKRKLVAAMLTMTSAEAKKFWAAYDDYQRDLDMYNRRRVRAVEEVISRDKPISDIYAKMLAKELIEIDEQEIKSRRKLHNRVIRALPDKMAARYLQLESKIRAIYAYDIASTIPLVK